MYTGPTSLLQRSYNFLYYLYKVIQILVFSLFMGVLTQSDTRETLQSLLFGCCLCYNKLQTFVYVRLQYEFATLLTPTGNYFWKLMMINMYKADCVLLSVYYSLRKSTTRRNSDDEFLSPSNLIDTSSNMLTFAYFGFLSQYYSTCHIKRQQNLYRLMGIWRQDRYCSSSMFPIR